VILEPGTNPQLFDRAALGKPAGQRYGIGAPWTRVNNPEFNRTQICGQSAAGPTMYHVQ